MMLKCRKKSFQGEKEQLPFNGQKMSISGFFFISRFIFEQMVFHHLYCGCFLDCFWGKTFIFGKLFWVLF
jgi:hypothetical protein